ncbi:MAG: glycosyltransferase family 87 protein [Acidiphilium sp.]|nr:glycosyltransferase family 87 protein [Acidiphilium sp.]MDD4934835.1 glycosyltransferase family 87 protein [Acidiphilium sp.]
MTTLRKRLRQHVPARVALPWLVLFLLSPCWLIYAHGMVQILSSALASTIFPGSVPIKALRNDLIVFWPVSHLMLTHNAAKIYDPVWFSHWRAIHLERGVLSYLQYPYPPPALFLPLLIEPFNYAVGFLVWTVILIVPGVILLHRAKVPWVVIAFGLVSAPGFYSVRIGQFGILTGAMFIAGLLSIDRGSKKSGILFGALVIKPQAGLLGPVVLLARREYQAIAIGVITIAIFSICITLLCGFSIWSSYINHGLKQAHHILIAPFPTTYENSGISVFWMFRSFGTSVGIAGFAQTVCAASAIIWCWAAWHRPETDKVAQIALTASLTLLVTPYGYTDDMCGFSIMVAWLAWERRRLEIADVLMWMWPALCPIISVSLHMELTPLILILGAIRAWKRLAGIGTTTPACYPLAT